MAVGFLGAAAFFYMDSFRNPVEWIDPACPERLLGRCWELLTITASGCQAVEQLELPVVCGTLLIPGDCGDKVLQLVRGAQVVSYGVSGRDSLTFSSMETEQRLLCIQRSFHTLCGMLVEPQEILLPQKWRGLSDEAVLAWMGTKLLLGE